MQAVNLPPHVLLDVARRPRQAKRLGVKFNDPPAGPISAPPQGTPRDTGRALQIQRAFYEEYILRDESVRKRSTRFPVAPKKSPRAARDLDRALTFPPPHAVLDRDLRVRQMEAERRPAAARRLGLSPARGFISGAFSSYYDA